VNIVVNNFTYPCIVVNNFTFPNIVVNKREELMLLEAAM